MNNNSNNQNDDIMEVPDNHEFKSLWNLSQIKESEIEVSARKVDKS